MLFGDCQRRLWNFFSIISSLVSCMGTCLQSASTFTDWTNEKQVHLVYSAEGEDRLAQVTKSRFSRGIECNTNRASASHIIDTCNPALWPLDIEYKHVSVHARNENSCANTFSMPSEVNEIAGFRVR